MELGVTIPHTGPAASADFIRAFCLAAEALGYAGLWVSDHVVMPPRFDSLYTLARRPARLGENALSRQLSPMYEMLSTLLWVAAFTQRPRLYTGVAVLPLRNPVLHARMLATLDVFSGGRLTYGAGAGWLREEAEALQMPWDRRGARTEEHIGVLRRIWTAAGPTVDFEGEFYRFGPMDPEPRPVQKPCPPIFIGGHSDVALQRAARLGDGWIAHTMSPDRFRDHRDRLLAAAAAAGRDPAQIKLVVTYELAFDAETGDRPVDPPEVLISAFRAYRAAGVHHLRLISRAGSRTGQMHALRWIAEEIAPAVAAG